MTARPKTRPVADYQEAPVAEVQKCDVCSELRVADVRCERRPDAEKRDHGTVILVLKCPKCGASTEEIHGTYPWEEAERICVQARGHLPAV